MTARRSAIVLLYVTVWLLGPVLTPAPIIHALPGGPVKETRSQLQATMQARDCADRPGDGRTLLLVRTDRGGLRLLPDVSAAADPDGWSRQNDWLHDEAADLFGWCR